ncbi:MAG: YHYH protein [Gammaproteobacteria bacterium]
MGLLSRVGLFASVAVGWAGGVWAHGVHETGNPAEPAARPGQWWEVLLSEVRAAATVRVDEQGGYRYIQADGLPDHASGQFPNRGNPHAIERQNYEHRLPLKPVRAGRTTPVDHAAFGVATNGVPFDAATAEYWNRDRRWNIEALSGAMNLGLDSSNAHVQPNGAYHYHGLPWGILKRKGYRSSPLLIGWAADGFPIYGPFGYAERADASSATRELKPSYRLKSGARDGGPGGRHDGTYTRDWEYVAGLGDLDECNGRQGVTPEYPDGIYHYVVTGDFPHIPRCWVGEPDRSFFKGPGAGTGGGGPPGGASRPNGREFGAGGFGRGQGRPERPGPDRGNFGGPGGAGFPGGPPRRDGGGGGPGGRRGPPPQALEACAGRAEGESCSFQAPFGTVRGQCGETREGELACKPGGGPPGMRR